jgi:hypothetical protein
MKKEGSKRRGDDRKRIFFFQLFLGFSFSRPLCTYVHGWNKVLLCPHFTPPLMGVDALACTYCPPVAGTPACRIRDVAADF